MNQLLILSPDAEEYARLLAPYALEQLTIHTASHYTTLDPAQLKAINLVLGDPPWLVKLLAHLPELQWVQSTFAGVNALCAPQLPRHYQLTNVKAVFGPSMSEYVFGYILALERDLLRARMQQQQHRWQPFPYRSLVGLTLGIAGLGDIGQHLASTAQHFGMRVKGLKLQAAVVPQVDEVYTVAELSQFLQELDYLVITLPATTQTQHLFNATALAQLKTEAVLINVGRGACVDQVALTQCLKARQLRAAVLDVFAEEPLAADDPLWDLEQVYITPHQAAVSVPADIVKIFVRNYQRFQQGQPLDYLIDFTRGY
ncbi:D-2-hydroxyacid dehydrogenase [Thiothrix eikelboomii]|uniref:D-2-hydroxyacid dehydrogenase n=1 Tax=Thiothrix eikelboomii TaxID=92487 RepID=UPI003BAF5DB9